MSAEKKNIQQGRRWLSRVAEPVFFLPVIGIVVLGVIWGTTWNLVQVERGAALRAAAGTSRELVETYEAQVVRALREIDQTLKLVAYAHERSGRADLAELKAKGLLPPELLFSVRIADTEGHIVARTGRGESADISREDYFLNQKAGDAFSIGRPQRDPSGREWRLHFSRRLSSKAAAFDGVVVVSVAAEYFVSGYEPERMGEHGALGLLGADGIFRVRRTGDQVASGDAANYAATVGRGRDGETRLEASGWDGVRRFIAARELYDFPVAAVVALAESEQLAEVDARARVYFWRAAGGSAVVVLLLLLLGRMSAATARFRRDVESALNLRKRAIESSVNAILIADHTRPENPIDYVNPAFEKITGYAAAEVVGRDMGFLLGPEPEQPGMQDIRIALREQREGHAILRNFRKDGSVFWNDFHMSPVKDEQGSVTHYVGIMNDVTAAKDYEVQLEHRSNFDALTGLANRNLLQDRLQQAIANARRAGGTVIAVFLDIDHFKLVNDTLGHTTGDELLQRVAERLRACVRETDTVARLGGDEFVLVLSGRGTGARTLEADVTALMNKLLAQVAQPLILADRHLTPTISIGVSIFPQDGDTADEILSNADAAMYRSKELGRNRYQFYTADVHERIQRRMELESSLRRAIERDEFELHYQPQVGLRTGMIVGVEALLRWRHPEKGLIGPAQFVPFAEETGLIVPIGEWVLRRACQQNKAWQDMGLPHIPVAVNMSAKQCEQADIDRVVRRILHETGLNPACLELEITESMSMAVPDESVPLLTRLKQTGVSLSIDDFGTGFSNLSYLRRFPVDRLKIDLSFVREIATDAGSLAISEAIITMSHSLNLQVVAEGVETQAQLDLLGARNCDLIQGYLMSPPLEPDAFARLIADDPKLYAGRGVTHPAPTMVM